MMNTQTETIAGQNVLTTTSLRLDKESDALAVLGLAMSQNAAWVLLPVSSLHPDFFKLGTGLAGGVAQKFVNYRVKLAVVGDIQPMLGRSAPLRDFVRETNKGSQLWFVADLAAFASKLQA